MGLFKRGEIWYYGRQVNGERLERSTRQGNQSKAQVKAAIIESEFSAIEAAGPSLGLVDAAKALDDYLETLRAGGAATQTVIGVACLLRRYLRGHVAVPVDPAISGEWLLGLHRSGLAASSLFQYQQRLRGFYTFCVERGWLLTNPVPPASRRKRGRGRDDRIMPKRAFTQDELHPFLSKCRSPYRAKVYRVMVLSGLRKSEVRLLERRDFDEANWHLRPEITKSKRLDVVPMLPECREIMAEHMPLPPTTRVFPSSFGSKMFDKDLRRAGLSKLDGDGRRLSSHSLRYTFVTWLARAGVPIQEVQRLARHATLQETVKTYLDLGLEDLARSVADLPRMGI